MTETAAETLAFTTNNLWMMVATALVFVMHLGFAALEAGMTRSKNTVNILFKNTMVPALGLLTYAAVGFALMYPGGSWAGIVGFAGFGLGTDAAGLTPAYDPGYTYWTDFLFQGMFAATAATIVSGAVAERVKLSSFLVFSVLFVAFCYPIVGMWKWGGGFLDRLPVPFHDFAGSTLVHGVGGWGALAGALLLGPRMGRFTRSGAQPIPGHSMPLATIGVFLLWLGWFGFNGGSVLSADPGAVSRVLVTTNLAAAAGAVSAALASWRLAGKPDLTMALNGVLAGLVGITAGADVMGPGEAMFIGTVSGLLVVGAVVGLDRLRLDDPVGAVPVHLVNGVWGTLAVGLLGEKAGLGQLAAQAFGVAVVGLFTFGFAYATLWGLKRTLGLRVDPEEELEGLDLGEHGMRAYDLGAAPAAGRMSPLPAPVLQGDARPWSGVAGGEAEQTP